MHKYVNDKMDTSILILSILIAFFIDIKAINRSLVYSGIASEGLMTLLYPVILMAIFILSIFSKKIRNRINGMLLFLIFYIAFFYFVTLYFIGSPYTSFPFVLVFVLAALAIPSIGMIYAKEFLFASMAFPCFAIFYLDRVFAMTKDWSNTVSMDVSYGFLIPIIANIVYLFYYFKDEKFLYRLFVVIISIINGVYFVQLFLHGSRGPLLCIIMLIVFLLVVKTSGVGLNIKKGRIPAVAIAVLIVVVGYATFFSSLESFLGKHEIQSYAVSKIIALDADGNLSNGRTRLNVLSLNGFWDSPILGNGFDRFDANTGNLYPHNFILQILYDGGLVFFFVIFIPVIVGMIKKFKSCSKDELLIIIALMFSSVPGAMFSGDLYQNGVIWLFFGTVLSWGFVKSKSEST